MSAPIFRPISDKAHFPILTIGTDIPCAHLLACENLAFFAPENVSGAYPVIRQEGTEWHLYGDARWPSPAAWVEFDTNCMGFPRGSGVLVLNTEIPNDEVSPLDWVAINAPTQQIFPEERSEKAIQQKRRMLGQQATSQEKVSGPIDQIPRFAQSYCIYRLQEDVRLVACYLDILNGEGIPIPKYRTASVSFDNFCRFSLHALFRLNGARIAGMKFAAIPQLQSLAPVYLEPGQKNPTWATFHPTRVLKTRPSVRNLPTPENMVNGIMQFADFQHLAEVRRREANLELLAHTISARQRSPVQEDTDTCMAAFTHRANGGAIYVLPDRLVEEFDNTDCDEVRISDIKLPFRNVFIKFTSPQPLHLADGAVVDGCYIVEQDGEYFISLTSRWEDVDYARSLSISCMDPRFNLHLPATDPEMSINAAVEQGIRAFMEENSPPTEDLSQTIERPDGTLTHFVDGRAKGRKRRISIFQSQEPVFRACLNIIVNAACYISFRPDEISEEWEVEPPAWITEAINDPKDTRRARDRKRDALRHIATGDYVRVKVCGKSLFSNLPRTEFTHPGVSPRAHWRRGHWRRQRSGPGLSIVIPRWIRPTVVKKDSGPLVDTRIYEVQEPQSDTPPTL